VFLDYELQLFDLPLRFNSIFYSFTLFDYPIDRYVNETPRLYRTLDLHLTKNKTAYVMGDRVTVAEIAIWP